MALSRNIHKLTDAFMNDEQAQEHRRGGRMPMIGVKSNLGRVLDLSHCGVLIRRSGLRSVLRVDQEVVIVLKFDQVRAAIRARIARKLKKAGVGWVYGLEFLDISSEQREMIRHIGQSCHPKQIIPGNEAAV